MANNITTKKYREYNNKQVNTNYYYFSINSYYLVCGAKYISLSSQIDLNFDKNFNQPLAVGSIAASLFPVKKPNLEKMFADVLQVMSTLV